MVANGTPLKGTKQLSYRHYIKRRDSILRLNSIDYNYDAKLDILRLYNSGVTSGVPSGDYCSSEVYTITNEHNDNTYVGITNFKKHYSLDEYGKYIDSFEVLKVLPEIYKRVLKDGKSIV